jgi:hypothetical protein
MAQKFLKYEIMQLLDAEVGTHVHLFKALKILPLHSQYM